MVCLNITYELYASFPNRFLEDHGTFDNSITVEHTGGKKHRDVPITFLLTRKQQQKSLIMM